MAAQKAQADVLIHRPHCALAGWDAAAERREAREWADGDFDTGSKALALLAEPAARPVFGLPAGGGDGAAGAMG